MAYEMKPGQGSAWPNDKKTEDWHADFRGRVMLPDGKTHWLDVTPKSTDGKTWYSVKIGKEVQPAVTQPYSAAHKPFPAQDAHNKAKANGFAELDDDVPF
jgi:hypothetical protein